MPRLIRIRSFSYRHEAEMARELLERQGIDVLISGDDASGVRPALAFAGGIELLVDEEDEPKARKLLTDAFGD